jgi:ring-1,2-phenylacetyl-CoA epoxidase subunit PaaE
MSPLAAAPSRHALHTLGVDAVESITEDSVSLTFDIPDRLREVFRFTPGQHVALVRREQGHEVRRTYSVCSPVGGPLRVAVKRLPGGAFSTWVHETLRPGDQLDVLPPMGHFTVELDPTRARHYAAIAVGSGITPVISIIASALAAEPDSRCTLIYGNRATSSIMFLEELEDLKNAYPERFQLIHVLSREAHEVELAQGRLDGPKLRRLLDTLLAPELVDEWFLCGPLAMVQAAQATLNERGVDNRQIRRELFHAGDAAPPAPSTPTALAASEGATVTIVLDGRRTSLTVPHDGGPILEAALAVRPDAPYACKGGVCGTCRCRLIEGKVRMDHAYALEDEEINAGMVLACQSHPLTETVVLDFDAS